MEPLNVIAKVRFSSAKAQRVHLEHSEQIISDLLCLESGQEMSLSDTSATIYVITGSGQAIVSGDKVNLSTGYLAVVPPGGTIRNTSEQRLVCLEIKLA